MTVKVHGDPGRARWTSRLGSPRSTRCLLAQLQRDRRSETKTSSGRRRRAIRFVLHGAVDGEFKVHDSFRSRDMTRSSLLAVLLMLVPCVVIACRTARASLCAQDDLLLRLSGQRSCFDSGTDLQQDMDSAEGRAYAYRLNQLCKDDSDAADCENPRACTNAAGVPGTLYSVLRRPLDTPGRGLPGLRRRVPDRGGGAEVPGDHLAGRLEGDEDARLAGGRPGDPAGRWPHADQLRDQLPHHDHRRRGPVGAPPRPGRRDRGDAGDLHLALDAARRDRRRPGRGRTHHGGARGSPTSTGTSTRCSTSTPTPT